MVKELIVLGIGGILSVVYLFWLRNKESERRSKFKSREIPSLDEWHSRFYRSLEYDRELAEMVIHAVAKDIGIAPTQLLPTDRIVEDLCYGPTWMLVDSPLEVAIHEIGTLIMKRTGREWRPGATVKTLGDLINDVMSACSAEGKTERAPRRESAMTEE